MSRPRVLTLLPPAALSIAALMLAPGAHAAVTCDRFASPQGADTSSGVEAAPYRSAQRLADSLSAGQTGCLRAGIYSQDVTVTRGGVSGSPITVRSYPGEQATIVGRLWIKQGADFVTFESLHLDGRTSSGLPSPSINANDVTFRNNDVTNAHTAICFVVGASNADSSASYGRAARTVIASNRIHNCGRLPATNHDHGIYVEASDDVQIAGNWIYDNADRGIQLYPDAQRTVIAGNVIDGNNTGLVFSGDLGLASNGNTVEGNVITNAKLRFNVDSWYPDGNPVGQGNVLRTNCVYGSARRDYGTAGINTSGGGFTSQSNTVADPQFVDRAAKDFRLSRTSSCRASYGGNPDAVPGVSAGRSALAPAPPAPAPAPDTTVTGGPSGATTSTSASLSFTSTAPGSTFQCKLGTSTWSSCTSPRSYSRLAGGGHAFSVRAIDAAGMVDGTPALRSWTVSTTSKKRRQRLSLTLAARASLLTGDRRKSLHLSGRLAERYRTTVRRIVIEVRHKHRWRAVARVRTAHDGSYRLTWRVPGIRNDKRVQFRAVAPGRARSAILTIRVG